MNPSKLRALLYEKDKNPSAGSKNPSSAINQSSISKPNLGSSMPGGSLTMPTNKSAPTAMSPGLPNPMGHAQPISSMPKPPSMGMPKTIGAPKMTLPNPTAAPSIVGQSASLPKPARFAKTKKLLKPTKEF